MKLHSKNKSTDETEEKGLTVCLSPVYPLPQLPFGLFSSEWEASKQTGALG